VVGGVGVLACAEFLSWVLRVRPRLS
jgi:hypothetical protein